MSLDTKDIERIARRVAELIGDAAGPIPARYVDAAALARTLGVERSWVYAHADELGAVRLGGPGGRLRFDLEDVWRRLPAARASESRQAVRQLRRRSRQAVGAAPLIPYDG